MIKKGLILILLLNIAPLISFAESNIAGTWCSVYDVHNQKNEISFEANGDFTSKSFDIESLETPRTVPPGYWELIDEHTAYSKGSFVFSLREAPEEKREFSIDGDNLTLFDEVDPYKEVVYTRGYCQ